MNEKHFFPLCYALQMLMDDHVMFVHRLYEVGWGRKKLGGK